MEATIIFRFSILISRGKNLELTVLAFLISATWKGDECQIMLINCN